LCVNYTGGEKETAILRQINRWCKVNVPLTHNAFIDLQNRHRSLHNGRLVRPFALDWFYYTGNGVGRGNGRFVLHGHSA
ncbi:MAG: hypothetical protein IAE79_00490, partial [Anaerolinea sp.]|nr:hypothetical protein [Anaerolinea sp.]